MSAELEAKYRDRCPKPGTKVRNATTGDAAVIVEEDNEWWIKPESPNSPVRYPATQIHRWIVEKEPTGLPYGTHARVAYEAIKALGECNAGFSRMPEWLSLHAREKRRWLEGNIAFKEPLAQELYNDIVKRLKDR